jgi:hypothetical protein
MTFPDIAAGASVFLDANSFIYHFIAHPVLGPACTTLLERIENKEIQAFTSSHVFSEMAHQYSVGPRQGWRIDSSVTRPRCSNCLDIGKQSMWFARWAFRFSRLKAQTFPCLPMSLANSGY